MDYEPPQERETRSITADREVWEAVEHYASLRGVEPEVLAGQMLRAGIRSHLDPFWGTEGPEWQVGERRLRRVVPGDESGGEA